MAKKIITSIACVLILWAVDYAIYGGGVARAAYGFVSERFDGSRVSGTVRETSVNSGYVILYLSRNRPCKAIGVPLAAFGDEFRKAVITDHGRGYPAAVLNVGQTLIGEKVTARGDPKKQQDGSTIVFVATLRDIHFQE